MEPENATATNQEIEATPGKEGGQTKPPIDYTPKTPPMQTRRPEVVDAMEEDEGSRWDRNFREGSMGTEGFGNDTTPSAPRERAVMGNGLVLTVPSAQGRTQYGTSPAQRGEIHHLNADGPQPQETVTNQAPPYTTLGHTALTPIPQGGFPEVHGWTNSSVFTGVDQEVVQEWKSDGVCKCFIYPLDAGAEANRSAMADSFQTTIARLFGTQDVQVGEPLGAQNGPFRPPWLYITAAPLGIAQALVQRRVWSTPEATFMAIPFTPHITTYSFTLANFRVPANEQGGGKIADLVCKTMKNSERLLEFLTQNFPEDVNDFEAIRPEELLLLHADAVTASPLTIARPKNTGSEILWNIHIPPISQEFAIQNEWITILKSLRYYIPYMSVGTIR